MVSAVQHVQAALVARVGVENFPVVVLVEHADPGTLVAGKGHHLVVVIHLLLLHLFRREGDVIVPVEVVAVGRHPLEAPAHASFVGLELVQRRPGHRHQVDVPMIEMNDDTVVVIGPERAAGTTLVPFRPEHEVINDQLAFALK